VKEKGRGGIDQRGRGREQPRSPERVVRIGTHALGW
jgi:hypothetical protein